MKYIRTKEHIYKRLFIDRAIINECGYGECDKNLNPLYEQIIAEADTVEELCDEFVYHFLYNNTYEIMPKQDLEPQRRDCLLYHIEKRHHDVLGAIFTDKGLIYVAKMNEKGELCLI